MKVPDISTSFEMPVPGIPPVILNEPPGLNEYTPFEYESNPPVTKSSSAQKRGNAHDAAPVVAVGALLGVIRAEAPLGDSDVLWGARAGMDILSSGNLPHHATYSWTAAGRARSGDCRTSHCELAIFQQQRGA